MNQKEEKSITTGELLDESKDLEEAQSPESAPSSESNPTENILESTQEETAAEPETEISSVEAAVEEPTEMIFLPEKLSVSANPRGFEDLKETSSEDDAVSAQSAEASENETDKESESDSDDLQSVSLSENTPDFQDQKTVEKTEDKPSADNQDTDETTSGLNQKSDKSSSGKKKVSIVIGIIAVALLAVYLIGVFHFSNTFLPGTYVDGLKVGNKSADEILTLVNEDAKNRSVTITGTDGKSLTVRADEIDLSFKENVDFKSLIQKQNAWNWPIALMTQEKQYIESDYSYSQEKLGQIVNSSSLVNNDQAVAAQNATVVYNGSEYIIQEEVYGTQVDPAALEKVILTLLAQNISDVSLTKTEVYIQPTLTKDSQTLTDTANKLNQNLQTVITYHFGNDTEVLDKNTFAGWMTLDDSGNVAVDEEQVSAYVEGLADKYDTIGESVSFETSTGTTATVTNWGYGWEIDQEEETEELTNLLKEGTSTDREPVYYKTGADRTSTNPLGNSYVEISIANQMMWCYENGELVTSTPIVTGTAGTYDTPKGLYSIYYKETDVTLKGEDYESPVTFWIPFNGGIGIHDASWRSVYGGTIYQSSGSHGCVNTPYAAASLIYDSVEAGEPVVVW